MYLNIFLRIASACSVGKIQRRLQGKFVLIFKFIMQNSYLFVAGSIHQDHEIFSDISTGRKFSFVSFSASLRAQSRGIQREYSSKPLKHSIVECIVV